MTAPAQTRSSADLIRADRVAIGIDNVYYLGEDYYRMFERHPDLTLVVPHLGADEIPEYGELLRHFPNLWLDTTMMLADFFPQSPTAAFIAEHADRLLYGSDFPGLPYAWDRELKKLVSLELPPAALQAIAAGNAERALGL